jgi:hypothetical protein
LSCPEHAKGKDKAPLSANRLGITLENKEVLEEVLWAVVIHDEATLKKRDQYGDHYNIKFLMQTDVGESWVLSCWIVATDEDFPRLTNAYPIGLGGGS